MDVGIVSKSTNKNATFSKPSIKTFNSLHEREESNESHVIQPILKKTEFGITPR